MLIQKLNRYLTTRTVRFFHRYNPLLTQPHNPITGCDYYGDVYALLLGVAFLSGYNCSDWATQGQWKWAGRAIKPGEHGTLIPAYKTVQSRRGKLHRRRTRVPVYNFLQTERMPEPTDQR